MGAVSFTEEKVRLSREGGVIDLEFSGLDDSDISGDLVSGTEFDDVSWDELGSIDLDLLAVSDGGALRWEEVFEGVHEGVRLGGLHVGDGSRQENDDEEHDGEVDVGETLGGGEEIGHDTEASSDPEHDGEPVGDFFEEEDPAWGFLAFWEGVISEFEISPFGFSLCESVILIRVESFHEFFDFDFVVIHGSVLFVGVGDFLVIDGSGSWVLLLFSFDIFGDFFLFSFSSID